MKTGFRKTMVAVALTLTGVLGMLSVNAAFAQADSTTGNGALNWRAIIPLYAQERETPVVNNTTVQQITQVVQPNAGTTSAQGSGIHFANAYASCNAGGTLLGGGGSCRAVNGYASMPTSQPSGNGWQIECDAFEQGYVVATAYANCSY